MGSTYLGTSVQASTAIFAPALSLTFQIPLSLAQASSIRIGNLLGQNLWRNARHSAQVTQIASLAVVLASVAVLLVFKSSFARVFSDDEEVIALVDKNVSSFTNVSLAVYKAELSLYPCFVHSADAHHRTGRALRRDSRRCRRHSPWSWSAE